MTPAVVEMVEARYTARELLREILRRRGRVYRMHHNAVFVLTRDAALADWMLELGGKSFRPRGIGDTLSTDGGYWRDGRDERIREWDIYIHTIPVKGEQTIWEAAKRSRRVELEVIE